MASKIKVYKIFIDGIDKCGKDTIAGYIDLLSNHKYVVKSRGVLSQIAYSYLYGRDFDYDLSSEQNTLHVLVDVSLDDWLVRCKLTNEPHIDYRKNVEAFDYAYNVTKDKLRIERLNSTTTTPYQMAKYILLLAEMLNNEVNDGNA